MNSQIHDIMAHLYKIAVGHEVQMGREIDITANKIMAADMYLRYVQHESIAINPFSGLSASAESSAVGEKTPTTTKIDEFNRRVQNHPYTSEDIVTFDGTP
jgi:hypothetical protein